MRMGRDKATLQVAGRALIEYSLGALEEMRPVPQEIIVAVSPDSTHELRWSLETGALRTSQEIRILADASPYLGPLSGLATVLGGAVSPVAVVLACDMPFVSAPILEYLLSALESDEDARAAVFEIEGVAAPFPGAYTSSLAPNCEDLLKNGDRSVQALLSRSRVVKLPLPPWADPRSLESLDSPEDVRLAESRLAAGNPE